MLQVEKTPAHNKGLFGSIQSEFVLSKGSCLFMKFMGKVELNYLILFEMLMDKTIPVLLMWYSAKDLL